MYSIPGQAAVGVTVWGSGQTETGRALAGAGLVLEEGLSSVSAEGLFKPGIGVSP